MLWAPWTIKVLYGFVSDAFPICGYQRSLHRPVHGGELLHLDWPEHDSDPHILVVGTLMTISSMTMCVTDVMVDSILVYIAREEEDQRYSSVLCMGCEVSRGMVAALFGGLAYEHVGRLGGSSFCHASPHHVIFVVPPRGSRGECA